MIKSNLGFFSKMLMGLGLLGTVNASVALADAGLEPMAPPRAQLKFSANSVDFGAVQIGNAAYRTITVTNVGNTYAANLSGVIIGDGNITFSGGRYPGTSGSCGTYLFAADSCTVEVSFFPQDPDKYRGTLRLYYYDGSNSHNISLGLQGKGAY